MLEALTGNKNVTRILLFIFVNGKCYGSQLHRCLHVPLTPLQKALTRLEKGGIITSYHEGKTRLYQYNPAYPLLGELELLLKKAYTLLSAEEKKAYYVVKDDLKTSIAIVESKGKIVLSFWEKLQSVTALTFHAKTASKEAKERSRKGQGHVVVTKEGANVLIFHEKGTWHSKDGTEVDFSNVFRWTLDRHRAVIALEHLRQGPQYPVFLFHLAPFNTQCLVSVDSHLCEGDTYFGQMGADPKSLSLHVRGIGPKKDEEMNYYYNAMRAFS